jgi:hypothetical protein
MPKTWTDLLLGLVLGMALLVPRAEAQATTFNCHNPTLGCPWEATCTGDVFQMVGPCRYQCYVYCGDSGQICPSGSAQCGT